MSLYFHPQEFACHDGTKYPEDWTPRLSALCSQLDQIRRYWKGPLRVVSGYRTPDYNIQVGGAPASQHVKGNAADIAPTANDMDSAVQELHGLIQRLLQSGQLPLVGGIGYYPGRWIHVDIRPRPDDGHVATWVGTGIGSEQS